MAITTAMSTSFKKELLEAVHNFLLSGGDAFKIALYTSTAALDKTTTVYSATNEISGAGYTAGGNALTRINPSISTDSGITDFADEAWTSASFTANGANIYNSTDGNKSVCTLAFGGDKTVSSGTFTVVFPVASAGTAVLELA